MTHQVRVERHVVVRDIPVERVQRARGSVAFARRGEFVRHAVQVPHRQQGSVVKPDEAI